MLDLPKAEIRSMLVKKKLSQNFNEVFLYFEENKQY